MIDHLSSLTKLRYLDLSNNRLTDLQGLEGLSSLEVLKLDNNPITNLSYSLVS